jgi:hypothetical protein
MALTDCAITQTGKSYLGEQSIKPQAMSMLEDALVCLDDAALMAAKTADALCGSQPADQKGDDQKASNGVFGRIEEIASRLRRIAGGISDDMQRIQNRL